MGRGFVRGRTASREAMSMAGVVAIRGSRTREWMLMAVAHPGRCRTKSMLVVYRLAIGIGSESETAIAPRNV